MKYQSPALWTPSEIAATDMPEFLEQTPENIAEFTSAEAERRNQIRLADTLGEKTGWGNKWMHEIQSAPTGEPWHKAFIAAAKIIESNGILILHGNRGPGKTRMAAELAVYQRNTRYTTAMRFFLEIRASFRAGSESSELEIISSLIATDLLIIDELQERGDTSFEDRLLTHLIDARYAAQRPTILIANLTKPELSKSLGPSIVSRLHENGAAIDCYWASFRSQSRGN